MRFPSVAAVSLLALSFLSSARAEEHWVEVHSPHFTVLSDAGEGDARHVAGQMESIRLLFETSIGARSGDDEAPMLVLALKNKKDFQALEPMAYIGKGKLDLAGYFRHSEADDYILLRLDAGGEHPFSTVYHEYTHYMVRDDRTWMPLWLNEGLAEFYQNTDILGKAASLGQASVYAIQTLREKKLIPIRELLTIDASSPYYHEEDKGTVFYAESWALVHLILTTDAANHTHRLQAYWMETAAGKDSVTAAQDAFGDLDTLNKQLGQYAGRLSYGYFHLALPSTVQDSAFQVQPISVEDADAIRARILIDNGREAEAEVLLESTLKADPTNARAMAAMGYADELAHKMADAEHWYGEAVKANPNDYLSQYRYAQVILRNADQARESEVEPALQKAISLNPRFAPSYDLLAHFYQTHQLKLDKVHMLEVQAVSLEPGNLNFRLHTAAELAAQSDYANALQVLQVARHIARNPSEVAMVDFEMDRIRKVQAMVERQQAQAAQQAAAPNETFDQRNTVPGQSPAAVPFQGITMISQNGSQPAISILQTAPSLPMEDPTGPEHTLEGRITEVKCYDPALMIVELDVHGKQVLLYRNNYFKVKYSTLGWAPEGALHPCTDLSGKRAVVQYSEVANTDAIGQILALQLLK